MPDAFVTAPHTAYPQLPNQGGPILAHPALVTVTFANDTRAPELEAYSQWIVGSSWIGAVGAEYGVSGASVAGVAHRPEMPTSPLTSQQIEAYLAAGVHDGSIPKPASLADALYLVYYPANIAITATFVHGITKRSCSDFGGYHGEVHDSANGLDFAYAVIPDCGGNGFAGLSAIELLEEIASHEIIEASTDARSVSAPAYQLTEDPTDAWFTAFQFEVEDGDLCEAPTRFVREDGHPAQRSWSNAAAAAGGEPCLPLPDNTAPAYGFTASPAGVQHAAAGSTATFTLTGWSTGTIADFRVSNPSFPPSGFVLPGGDLLNNGKSITLEVPISATFTGTKRIMVVGGHSSIDAVMWPLAIVVP